MPTLNSILNQYESAFNLGRTAIYGHSISLFTVLVTIEMCIAGIYIAIGVSDTYIQLARRILLFGFILFVVRNYDTLTSEVIQGFIQVGEEAGGASGSPVATLNDPDRIVVKAFQIIKPGMEALAASSHESWMGMPTLDAVITWFCLLIGMIALFLIAIQSFVTYLEFLLVSSLGLILIPFGAFRPTAFLAEKTFGAIVGFGIKLMVLALILGVTDTILGQIQLPGTVTWQSGFHFILVSLSLCFLALHAPAVALSLLHGQPMLTGAAITGGTFGAGASTFTTTKSSAMLLGGAVAQGAGMGVQGFNNARESYQAAHSSSSSDAGVIGRTAHTAASGMFGLLGGAGGILSGGINQSTISPIKQHVAHNYSRGKQAVPKFRGSSTKQDEPKETKV